MFGAALVASVLALAGAPATTQVFCSPDGLGVGVPGTALGVTFQHADQLDPSSPPLIRLVPQVCAGLTLLSAAPTEITAIQALNPTLNFDALMGVGLLVMLHEAEHASGIRNETDAQCRAMAQYPALLQSLVGNDSRPLFYARDSDASLPPAYHAHAC